MRTKLSFALASAALACGTVWGCGDDDPSSPNGGGSGGMAGTGMAGSSGNAGTSMGGTGVAGEGGNGGSGNSSGSAGEDAGVVPEDASVGDDASVPEEDASTGNGGSGPGVDSGSNPVDAGSFAEQLGTLCPQWCQQQAFCVVVDQGDCQNFCTSAIGVSTACEGAVFAKVNCEIALPQNAWTCEGDAGAQAQISSTGCETENDAASAACGG
jgi:hypothetical protein